MNFTKVWVFIFVFFAKNFNLCFCDQEIENNTEIKSKKSGINDVEIKNNFYEQDVEFIKSKLSNYNLLGQKTDITYKYKTEIVTQSRNFELNDEIENFAKKQNVRLNYSIFFDPVFIRDAKKVREYHTKNKYFNPSVGQIIDLYTQDEKWIECTYFDRESDKLLIVGAGFTNEREVVSPFVDMFLDYDVVLFDYRGHGYKKLKITDPSTWSFSPTKFLFGAECNKVGLGAQEEKDVFAVVDMFRNKKNYKQVYGLGICYSAMIFLKAAAIRQKNSNGQEKLFDKIVLDGCWLTLENFVEKLAADPKRICSPQFGGLEKDWPVTESWFQNGIVSLAQKLFNTKFNQISVLDYLPDINNIPLLFFYGKNDLVINRHEFELMWNATKTTEKNAVITSNPHVINHLKQKELYKLICDLFFELDQNEFLTCLENKDYLVNYFVGKLYKY